MTEAMPIFLRMCDVRHSRLLKLLICHQAGQPLQMRDVMERFSVSAATAKRDLALVRKAVAVRSETQATPA